MLQITCDVPGCQNNVIDTSGWDPGADPRQPEPGIEFTKTIPDTSVDPAVVLTVTLGKHGSQPTYGHICDSCAKDRIKAIVQALLNG